MTRNPKAGQANTEYVVTISLVAVGLIAIVGIFALVLKWNFARTSSALAGGDGKNQVAAVAEARADLQADLARENRGGTATGPSQFSDDEDGKGAGGAEDASGYTPGRHPAAYQDAPGMTDPEPDTISASGLGQNQGSVATYYDASNVETDDFTGLYTDSRRATGSRSGSGSGSGSVFGIPWYLLLFLLLLLGVVFFFWATADQ